MSDLPKRPRVTKATRAAVLAKTEGLCWICRLPITDDQFDVDHELARELGGSDGIENLLAAHKHCHRTKTKDDIKLIAKGRRIRRSNGPVELRRKPKVKMRSRANWPPKGSRKLPSRKSSSRR